MKSKRFDKIEYMARKLYYDGDRRNAFITGVEYAYANPMDMWVAVDDVLPQMVGVDGLSDNVLVCSERGIIGLDCYDYGEQAWNASTEPITHWMPLPPPPQKEEIYK